MHLLNKIQNWTQNGPTGNHKQFIGTLATVLGVGAQMYGAYKGMQDMDTKAISPGEIRGHMSPVQANINRQMAGQQRMSTMGQDLMDPTSAMNLQQKGMMEQQGANQMALQRILQSRQNAAMGSDSGMMAAQQRAQQGQLSQQLGTQFQNQMMQNRTQGMGMFGSSQSLLGNINKQQLGVSENIAQSAIAQRQSQMAEEQRQRQGQQAFYGALGGGLSSMGSAYTQQQYGLEQAQVGNQPGNMTPEQIAEWKKIMGIS